jgi:2-keto-3-deoxy-L-fuconate dehydrogenase
MSDVFEKRQEFSGLVAIVTGGASGIGAAVCQELLACGAKVAVLDLNPQHDQEGTLNLRADVTDDREVESAISETVSKLNGIDIVVNSAGIGARGSVLIGDYDEWRRVMEVNVLGIVRVSRAAIQHLKNSGSAAIVNVGSIAASIGLPERALYSASKGAVHALTRAMAADFIGDGIRVNAVSPGTVDTPWIGRLLSESADPADEYAALSARQPHGRLVSAEEVAKAVTYLASPSSQSSVGTVLSVDGGSVGLRLTQGRALSHSTDFR